MKPNNIHDPTTPLGAAWRRWQSSQAAAVNRRRLAKVAYHSITAKADAASAELFKERRVDW